MLPHLDKILDEDLAGRWVPDLRGCSDCPNCLSCQTTGKPGLIISQADQMLDITVKALGIPRAFMIPGVTVLPTPEELHYRPKAKHVTGCFRPMGIGRRTLVPVEERHDYLWHSPCVPLKVKLIVACGLADKLVDQAEESVGPLSSVTASLVTMIHESRETFEAWGLARVPVSVRARDDHVWNAVNNTRMLRHVSAGGCLVELFLAFRQNLVDMGVRGSEEGIEGCRYTQYENLVNRCCEISSQTAGGENKWTKWQKQVTRTYGPEYGPLQAMKTELDKGNERLSELLQQRIDRILGLIKKGTGDSEEAKEVPKT